MGPQMIGHRTLQTFSEWPFSLRSCRGRGVGAYLVQVVEHLFLDSTRTDKQQKYSSSWRCLHWICSTFSSVFLGSSQGSLGNLEGRSVDNCEHSGQRKWRRITSRLWLSCFRARKTNKKTHKHNFTGLSQNYPATVPGLSRHFSEMFREICLCISLFAQEKKSNTWTKLTPIRSRDNPILSPELFALDPKEYRAARLKPLKTYGWHRSQWRERKAVISRLCT